MIVVASDAAVAGILDGILPSDGEDDDDGGDFGSDDSDDDGSSSFEDQGQAKGVDVELAQALAKALGVRLQLIWAPPGEKLDDDLRDYISRVAVEFESFLIEPVLDGAEHRVFVLDGRPVFHETWAMDAWGDARGSAMARLVSTPVSFAVESVLKREIAVGVHGAPHDQKLLDSWLGQVRGLAQYMERVNHL